MAKFANTAALLRRADVIAYRRLAALAAIATPVFWVIHRQTSPDAADSLWVRLVLVALCVAIVVLSYRAPTRRLLYLIYFTFYAYTAWVLLLLVQNRLDPNYAIGGLAIVATVSVSFLERRPLVWYLGATIGAVALVLVMVEPVSSPAVSDVVLISYLLLFCLLAFLILRGRLLIQEKLQASRQRYLLAAEGANDGLWDWDLVTDRVFYSPRWTEMLGLPAGSCNMPADWLGRIHEADAERVRAELDAHLNGFSNHFRVEFRIAHADGSERWMLARGMAVRDAGGRAIRIAGSQTDITDRKLAEEKLLHDAYHDQLTGLPNRAHFLSRVAQTAHRAQRRRIIFAVLFLDLDGFKLVNDSLGHSRGDQFLSAVAARLAALVRAEDTVARLGGDEFAILLGELGSETDVWRLVDRIHEEFARPLELAHRKIVSSVSIGVVFGPGDYQRPEDMLRDADVAMYRAKATGRGRTAIFDPDMHARTLARLELEADLRNAVDAQEFRLYYQPILDLQSGRLSGFEALIRWQHPTRGLLLPTEFIGAAEDNGLIVPIGRWVIREACAQLSSWQEDYPRGAPVAVSVNVSGRQLSDPDLVREVAEALGSSGLDPECLRLEITESVLLQDPDAAVDVLNALRALGVQLHLDDFGSGYSSFRYLHGFPVQAVKLDRSFVHRLHEDSRNAAIVDTLVTLAGVLNLQVVAEGVESTAELQYLRSLRCPLAQGFLFSEPLPPERAGAVLADARDLNPA